MHCRMIRLAALVLVAILLVTLTAACGRSARNAVPERKPAENTALATFTTADFSGAGLCAACHTGLKDEAGADVSMPTMCAPP